MSCDFEAERAALAVVLLEPRHLTEVNAAIELADFADQTNRTIYAAMLRLHSEIPSDDSSLSAKDIKLAAARHAADMREFEKQDKERANKL